MNEGIFRKKSLERIKSPESLEDYIRVANPSVWLLLISIIVLLTGACVWGALGSIDSTVPAQIRAENGELIAYVENKDISDVHEGMIVRVNGVETVIKHIMYDKDDDYFVCTLQADTEIPEGFYEGKVVVESIRPISFVFN